MRIQLTISQMEERNFLDKKWLIRIQLIMSQMEECDLLGKKWLIRMKNLVTPPRWRNVQGEEKQDPKGDERPRNAQ